MKGIFGFAAVGYRICQGVNDLVKFDNRARPAVGNNQRQGIFVGTAPVYEMYIYPVDTGRELWPTVEFCFAASPVVFASPVGGQLLCVIQRDTLTPVVTGFAFGSARLLQALFKAV